MINILFLTVIAILQSFPYDWIIDGIEPSFKKESRFMYKQILVATDLMDNSQLVVERAIQLHQQFNCPLFLLHVIELPATSVYAGALGFADFPDPITDDAKLVMKSLADQFNIEEDQQVIKIGPIAGTIAATAKETNTDLIVIGTHGSHGWLHLFSSTANAILHNVECDVLTIHN